MATQINNTISASYAYGRTGLDSSVSNVATTNLIEEFAISAVKQSLNSSFRPGENVTYLVTVRNDGTSPLYTITVSDDLGGATNPLTFLDGSSRVSVGGNSTSIIPTSTRPLVFSLTQPLNAGETATITYVARVNSALASDVNEITNTATVSAREGSATGATISVTPSPSATLNLEDYAVLNITKDVSSNEVLPGENFTYTVSLENTGSLDATNVVLTDILPAGFTISSISSLSNGVQTVYETSDYTVDPTTNTLTLPTGTDKSIVVPASLNGNAGLTIVTINGVFN